MHLRPMAFAAAMLCLIFSAKSAQSPNKAQKPPPPPPPVALDAPGTQAVFVNPRAPQEGRDPFFPRSSRPYASFVPVVKTNAQPVSLTAELRLGGISGSAEHRLAIINNKTFESGEEGDVISGVDKVRIRCVEIKPDSVIIQFVAGGSRREIHLRKGL